MLSNPICEDPVIIGFMVLVVMLFIAEFLLGNIHLKGDAKDA